MRHAIYVVPLLVLGAVESASAQLVPHPLAVDQRAVVTEPYYYSARHAVASPVSCLGTAAAAYPGAAATQPSLSPIPATAPITAYNNSCSCTPVTASYPATPIGSSAYPSYRPAAGAGYGAYAGYGGLPAGQYVGRGLIGQPKLYVSGQPLRNVLRYLSP